MNVFTDAFAMCGSSLVAAKSRVFGAEYTLTVYRHIDSAYIGGKEMSISGQKASVDIAVRFQ